MQLGLPQQAIIGGGASGIWLDEFVGVGALSAHTPDISGGGYAAYTATASPISKYNIVAGDKLHHSDAGETVDGHVICPAHTYGGGSYVAVLKILNMFPTTALTADRRVGIVLNSNSGLTEYYACGYRGDAGVPITHIWKDGVSLQQAVYGGANAVSHNYTITVTVDAGNISVNLYNDTLAADVGTDVRAESAYVNASHSYFGLYSSPVSFGGSAGNRGFWVERAEVTDL